MRWNQDLRNKFIVGAGIAGQPVPGAPDTKYGIGAEGGYTDATLPSHTHTVTASTEGSTLPNVDRVTFLSFFISILRINRYNPGNPPAFPSLPPSNNDAINGIAEGGNFGSGTPENSVSRGTLNSVGDPVIADKNLPPYYALAFIMRVS